MSFCATRRSWTSWWPAEGPTKCFPTNGSNICSSYTEYFDNLNGFKLASVSQPVPDPAEPARQFIAFTVEAVFPEFQRDE